MRFVPVKSAQQQSVFVRRRTRDPLIRQRTMLAISLRAHCAEFGSPTPTSEFSRIVSSLLPQLKPLHRPM